MGQGEARREKVLVIARDIERLRRRGESLTSELIDRAQPSLKTIRTVAKAMHDKTGLWKMLLFSPLFIGGAVCVVTGLLAGAAVQRARHRSRLRRTAAGRLLLAVTDA